MMPRRVRITSLKARPLSVPLLEPFVIATGRVDATRSAHIEAELSTGDGARALGIGEAAALPPVTHEDQPDVLASVERAAGSLEGLEVDAADLTDLTRALDAAFASAPVARSGVETAILDALARLAGVPLYVLLGGAPGEFRLTTDITIPIGEPSHMADLARAWRARGFDCFKVKVGKDVDRDIEALRAIAEAAPDASFRIDANAGFSAGDAIAFARALERARLSVECYEQPCAPEDLDAMAEVARAVDPPVIADESVKTLEDLARIQRASAADGVNLKLAKSGGPLLALAIGRAAQELGMPLMVGGMVETRLGMTAAAHVVAALGGVRFPDLDTAWLLAEDPYSGGYSAEGPRYTLGGEPGLGIRSL